MGEVLGPAELQIRLRRFLPRHLGLPCALQFVPGRANTNGILAGLKAAFGKAVTALSVADDCDGDARAGSLRSEEHTSELQSLTNIVCRLLLEKKNTPRTKLLNGPWLTRSD